MLTRAAEIQRRILCKTLPTFWHGLSIAVGKRNACILSILLQGDALHTSGLFKYLNFTRTPWIINCSFNFANVSYDEINEPRTFQLANGKLLVFRQFSDRIRVWGEQKWSLNCSTSYFHAYHDMKAPSALALDTQRANCSKKTLNFASFLQV